MHFVQFDAISYVNFDRNLSSFHSTEGLFTQKNPRTTPKNKCKSEKNPKNPWEWTTPRIHCLNNFFIHKIRKKSEKSEKKLKKTTWKKSEKSEKIQKKSEKYKKSLYTLFGSEQPLAFNFRASQLFTEL